MRKVFSSDFLILLLKFIKAILMIRLIGLNFLIYLIELNGLIEKTNFIHLLE